MNLDSSLSQTRLQFCRSARRPYFGAVLRRRHRLARVRWCYRVSGWDLQNWRRVWLSDESRFMLQKTCVYRCRNERFERNCVLEVDNFSEGSLMMCGVIFCARQTQLVHIPAVFTETVSDCLCRYSSETWDIWWCCSCCHGSVSHVKYPDVAIVGSWCDPRSARTLMVSCWTGLLVPLQESGNRGDYQWRCSG
jgi:hypothetical protein